MRKNGFILSMVAIVVISISIILIVSCDKKNIHTVSDLSAEKAQSNLLKQLPIKMEKINSLENGKNSVNLGIFISGEDYKYFKKNYPNIILSMNQAEIYAFPDYKDIYAVYIPYMENNIEGGLIIYKNLNKNKEFSVIKKVNKNTNDTIVSWSVLRNPQDAISITFSKGGSSINLRPNCIGDGKSDCYKSCATFGDCVSCSYAEIGDNPAGTLLCLAFGPECAVGIMIRCSGILED